MGRRRWTPERKRTLREADWIVGWLRANGPSTTRDLTKAMKHEGIELRAHVLNKALRKSPFVVHVGHEVVEGASLSVWKFSPGEEE